MVLVATALQPLITAWGYYGGVLQRPSAASTCCGDGPWNGGLFTFGMNRTSACPQLPKWLHRTHATRVLSTTNHNRPLSYRGVPSLRTKPGDLHKPRERLSTAVRETTTAVNRQLPPIDDVLSRLVPSTGQHCPPPPSPPTHPAVLEGLQSQTQNTGVRIQVRPAFVLIFVYKAPSDVPVEGSTHKPEVLEGFVVPVL